MQPRECAAEKAALKTLPSSRGTRQDSLDHRNILKRIDMRLSSEKKIFCPLRILQACFRPLLKFDNKLLLGYTFSSECVKLVSGSSASLPPFLRTEACFFVLETSFSPIVYSVRLLYRRVRPCTATTVPVREDSYAASMISTLLRPSRPVRRGSAVPSRTSATWR